MIDHVLGRPSVRFRKYQVFAVVSFWSYYLYKGNPHGPPYLRRISRLLSSRLTAWHTVVLTLIYLYITRNFSKLVGLECPEPLANLYTRSYFRATWVTTALDAGFWTAMNLRPVWLKDLASLVFSIYYLICAEQADEKVRRVRAGLTLEHLRVSWNKPNTPYINFFGKLMRPKLMRYPPRAIRIPRPRQSSYDEPIQAWLYFDGPISDLKNHDKIVLDIPGGGFVAMDPRAHDDKLLAWGARTGLPVLALDYKKAPEYPYPYALNECYDTYHTLVTTKGQCIGLSGETIPKIVVSGDSAGGNLAVGLILMILQSGSTATRRWQGETSLPVPEGAVLVYPALDMNIGNWMTDEQMSLIKDRKMRKTNRGVLSRKSDDYRKLTPNTPHGSEDEEDDVSPPKTKRTNTAVQQLTEKPIVASPTEAHTSAAHTVDAAPTAPVPQMLRTRLAMSSMISYFNDRVLTPEMMRAMIILYIGPHSRPDFSTDYLLSPLLAPEALLTRFPKTYMMTGERDPLVDDTVIFAGRLKQAKLAHWNNRKELGLVRERDVFVDTDHVNVVLIPGISHGFLQFAGIFPAGWKYISRCSRWMADLFREADMRAELDEEGEETDYFGNEAGLGVKKSNGIRHHRRMPTESSGDEDRPLEMSTLNGGARTSPKKKGSPRGGGRAVRGARNERPRNERMKSLVSLASEDDLLGRRMKGLTGNLMGDGGMPQTP
ncbi:lipase [Aureobasidium sp. EXF-10727]|nr:lipase [Aureobasidium sp. EXF-10727]KAI4724997.1 lipase [Aureobasidium sp. EXF-10728]